MPRPQFSLKTMLWLTVVVAGFFGGMAVQRAMLEYDRQAVRRYEGNLRAHVDERAQELSGSWSEQNQKQAQIIMKQAEEIWQLRRELAEQDRPPMAGTNPRQPATQE